MIRTRVMAIWFALSSASVSAQLTPDINLSGVVDLYDCSIFCNQFGWTVAPDELSADFNLDGVVSLPDFRILVDIMFPRCNPGDACLDSNPCTLDGCAPSGYCFHQPIPNCCRRSPDCIDGNVCNDDLCEAGYCLHPALKCNPRDCDDGNCCTLDACMCGSCAVVAS